MLVIVLGIPVLLTLIWMGGAAYAILITILVGLGLREYLIMLGRADLRPRWVPGLLAGTLLLIACMWSVGLFFSDVASADLGHQFTTIIILLLLILMIYEVISPAPVPWHNLSVNLVGVIWIAGFGGSFILVRSADYSSLGGEVDLAYRLTVALYITVWICDSLAYLFGKGFGKRKLFPAASPKKTVVGSVAGLIGSIILMLSLGYGGWLPRESFSVVDLLAFGLITGGIGQLGDFAESRLKRDFGVKDSSRLLPGHGGVLDRFDSLLFVMPTAWLYLTWAVF